MKYEIIDAKSREPIGAAFATEREAADYIRWGGNGLDYAYRQSSERMSNAETYNAGLLMMSLGVE